MDFADRLVYARRTARLQQKDLAKALHVDPGTVSAWERRECAPHVLHFSQLCDTLQVSADWLLRGVGALPAPVPLCSPCGTQSGERAASWKCPSCGQVAA